MKKTEKNPFIQVLKIKNFLKVWGSQLFSQITLNLVNFVIIIRIYEKTQSTVAVALVWVFYAFPAIIFGPFSGTLIDLLEKRKTLIWTNLSQAAIVLGYLLVRQKVWPMYTIVFLYSLVNQLYIPAEASALPGVVPRKFYPAANSIFMFTLYGSFLAGFTLAGPLVKVAGSEAPFFIASVLLGLAALSAYLLPAGLKPLKGEIKKINHFNEFWSKVKEGYVFIKGHPLVLFPLLLIVLSEIITGIIAVLAPSFAADVLAIDLLDAGLVLVTPAGLGALIGAQGVVWALKKGKRKKQVITLGLFLASLVLFCLGLVVPNLVYARIPLTIVLVFFMGISFVALIIPTQTLIQESTPEKLRGRVFGVLGFMITVAAILPVLLTATIADLLGVSWIIVLVGLLIGVLGIYSLKEPYLQLAKHENKTNNRN